MSNSLKENGYIVLKGVFGENELSKVRELTSDIVDYGELGLEDPFDQYFMRHRVDQGALYDIYFRHPEFRKMADNDTILDELETVLGKDIFLYENSLVYKPKGKNNEVPWHQDFMNRPDEPEKYIVWIALDDVTIENGALKIIPQSHKLGFLSWFKVKNETHHTRLKLDGVDLDSQQFVEMKAGDVLIFHQLVIHGSDKITSDAPRRAFRFACQGFESIYSPRAVPVVLRGGKPEELKRKFPNQFKEIGKVKEIIHKVGKKLLAT